MATLTPEQREANRRAHDEREAVYQLAKNNECSQCGAQLIVVTKDGLPVARCRNESHEGYRKLRSMTQMVRDGDAVNPFISARSERKRQERLEEKLGVNSRALAVVGQQGIITRETAMEAITALWPKAGKDAVARALMICTSHNLNPVDGEIFIVTYKRKNKDGTYTPTDQVIIGIPGVRKIARERTPYTYADGPRVMASDEQEEILGEVFPDQVVVTVTLKTPGGGRFPGFGMWPRKDDVQGADKGNTKFNMASYRAERNALKRIMPDSELPAPVGMVVQGVYAEEPAEQSLLPAADDTAVDLETGEVLDGEWSEPGAEPAPASPTFKAIDDLIAKGKEAGLSAQDFHDWIVRTAKGKNLSTDGETADILLGFPAVLFEDCRVKIEKRIQAAQEAKG